MVAYSFKACFADQVAGLTKLQTVRADRRRHARPGEPVQLYCGMRTRHCRKLVADDPICISVQPISIAVSRLLDDLIASISIDGMVLTQSEIETFAAADGFAPFDYGLWRGMSVGRADHRHASARSNMGDFWLANHGDGRFDGVLIKWGRQ